MTQTLDDYAAAFDGAAPPPDSEERWRRIDRAIRRRLRAPTVDLVLGGLVFVLLIVAAFGGVGPAWGYAGFFALVALPRRWRARREWLRNTAIVETAHDLRALCAKQSHDHFVGVVVRIVLQSVLAITFVLVGCVAYLLDRTPWPGVLAGLVLLVWVAGLVVFSLPRAARESRLLDDDDDGDDGDDEEEDDDDED